MHVESILKLDFHDVTFISQVVQLCDVHVLVLAAGGAEVVMGY